MFTGIIVDVGRVTAREARGGDERLSIAWQRLDPAWLRVGDSVCVQGCCLTVAALGPGVFAADVSRETLERTTLGELRAGAPVNLEPSLRAGDPLGGHLVSGHVDATARITAIVPEARSLRLSVAPPPELMRYIAPKGSVALDGVSLTVNEVDAATFGVNLIPHTQSVTTLGGLTAGGRVNFEIDQVARYLARLLAVPEP